MTEPALFARDGDTYVPLRWAGGPWDPEAQFGGAPAALLSTLLDRAPSYAAMHIARFTLDLLRPVPLRPLTATVRVVRDGKRIQVLEASLADDGLEVARATALRVHVTADTQPWSSESDALPVWAPADWNPDRLERRQLPGGFEDATDLCFTGAGQYPCFARLKVPVLVGEEVRPVARVAYVADFASYIAQPPGDELTGINADISLNIIRAPDDDWLCIDGRGWLSADGISQLQGLITDERGPVATVSMARLVFARV